MDLQLTAVTDAANPTEGDLHLDGEALSLVDGREAIAQHIRIRLRFFLGEWFLDEREGVPFYRDILIKNPSRRLVESVFRRVIIETPGVDSLDKFELAIDAATRTATLSFTAVTNDGERIRSDDYDPLILEGLS